MRRCCKCAGLGTRAHHRDCDHRGAGHADRGARVAWTEATARSWGLSLKIRRGRSGGQSLPKARSLLLRLVNRGGPTIEDLRDDIARVTGVRSKRVKVDVDKAIGLVSVTLPPEAPDAATGIAERALLDVVPIHIAFTVTRAARPV